MLKNRGSKIAIISLFLLIIASYININSRVNHLEEKLAADTAIIAQLQKAKSDAFAEEVSTDAGSHIQKDNELEFVKFELQQQIYDLAQFIERLYGVVFLEPHIKLLYGQVIGMLHNDDGVELMVELFDILRGDEAIEAYMADKGYNEEVAKDFVDRSGYYRRNTGDNINLLISKDCQVYLVATSGLVKASFSDLVKKVQSELDLKFTDQYTFVIINDRVVQVYQGY